MCKFATSTPINQSVELILRSLHLVADILEDIDVEPLDVLVPPVLVPLLAAVPVLHLNVECMEIKYTLLFICLW